MRLRPVVMMSALVAVVALASLAPAGSAATAARQSAVVMFADPVVIDGTFVMGLVKFVHDEERMARGEPCTQIFRVVEGKPAEELVAVHCKRVKKPVAEQFTMALRTFDLSHRILTAYQFAGDAYAHQLPTR